MSDKQYFSGNNLRQAVLSAASQLGLEPDDVVYEEVKKKGGTLKGRKRVVIVVRGDGTSAAPSDPPPVEPAASSEVAAAAPVEAAPSATPLATAPAEPAAAAPEVSAEAEDSDEVFEDLGTADEDLSGPLFSSSSSQEPKETQSQGRPAPAVEQSDVVAAPVAPVATAVPSGPVAEEATGRFAKAADKALVPLLEVAGLDIEAAMFQGSERLEIDLSGRDQDLLTAEKGELLQAVEHLMPRLIRGVAGETTAVRVDCDGFHAAREEELRQLALRLAQKVKASGEPHSTGPLEPSDRRIVHIAVEDDSEIVSRSDGRGFRKKVTLRPA